MIQVYSHLLSPSNEFFFIHIFVFEDALSNVSPLYEDQDDDQMQIACPTPYAINSYLS